MRKTQIWGVKSTKRVIQPVGRHWWGTHSSPGTPNWLTLTFLPPFAGEPPATEADAWRLLLSRNLKTRRLRGALWWREHLWTVVRNGYTVLTCVNEDCIHIDFGTERAQDKSAGWSKYQHGEQDSWNKKRKQRFREVEAIQWAKQSKVREITLHWLDGGSDYTNVRGMSLKILEGES